MEQKLLRAGQLARLVGVSTDLLRHYERIGVLPPPVRASNGYRLYSPQSVDRVRAVRRSLGLGFSLAELSGIFTIRDRGGVPCRSVRALAEEKLRRVEQAIRELRGLRQQLRQVLHKWNQLLAKTRKGERARLLESLREGPIPSNRSAAALKKGLSR
ncbi:MAG TPA: heavy metal-responsive transcriptional regulator [Candidatus Acidoferrum sp.]